MKLKSKYLYLRLFLLIAVAVVSTHIVAQEMVAGDQKRLVVKGRPTVEFVRSADEIAVKNRNKPLRVVKGPSAYNLQQSRSEVPEKGDHQTFKIYYKNGVRSDATRYLDTGRILISFGKGSGIDYQRFARENQLTFLRETNKLFRTAVFRFNQNEELIDLTNRLNQLPEVRRASPDWISPRRLR